MNMTTAIWKTIMIDDKELNYEVSNIGNIRNKLTGKLLKLSKSDYTYVNLYFDTNKSKKYVVHRLVANAFLENPLNVNFVQHKNYDKFDNRVENLEWVTRTENSIHAYQKIDRKLCTKAIEQCTPDGITVLNTFTSINEASNTLKIGKTAISNVLNKTRFTTFNFHFRYVEPKKVTTSDELDGFEKVKNHDKYIIHKDGRIYSIKSNMFMKENDGIYKSITLDQVKYSIHRLVALQFLPNPDNKPSVNHKDGNKLNNHVDNLEWATLSENSRHAFDTGLNPIMCSIKQYSLAGEYLKTFESYTQASIELGIERGNAQSGIYGCCTGKYKYAFGFIWKFLEDETDVIPYIKIGIKQYDLNGSFIKLHESLTDALLSINKRKDCTTQISNCCKKITKYAFGYIWRYTDDDSPVEPIVNIGVKQYTLSGNFVALHNSFTDALTSLGKTTYSSKISDCCQLKVKYAYNFIWRAENDDTPVEPLDILKLNLQNVEFQQYTLTGEYVNSYKTQREATLALGKNIKSSSMIGDCCKGKLKSAFGFTWKVVVKEND